MVQHSHASVASGHDTFDVDVHNALLLCHGAGIYGVAIGSKSTGVSKHYWTVFDVPGGSHATPCLGHRLGIL